jgi:dipeptidyl aminopeptidase/acylaminoacyl peptidase
MKKLCLVTILIISVRLYGQKPPLDHTVYDGWESINQSLISDNGEWTAFTVNPQQGDGWLYILNNITGKKDSVSRGASPVFSPGCRYVASFITPSYLETRQAKKKKLKDDQMPKKNIEIRRLPDNDTTSVQGVKSFAVPSENSDWMAYLLEKRQPGKKDEKKEADSLAPDLGNSKKTAKKPEPKGTDLVIYNPVLKKEYRYSDVTEYLVARDGNSISFVQDFPDSAKIESFRVTIFDTGKEASKVVFEGKGSVKKLSCDKSGNYTSFIYSSDTSRIKVYDLWLSKSFNSAARIVDTLNKSMPSGWSVSENGNLLFSENGKRLYFGTAIKPVKEPEDTLLDEEKYKLDIWSWDDDQLQPMQKKQLDQELKRSYQAIYQIDKNIMFQLADTSMPSVRINAKSSFNYILGSSNKKYLKLSSWDSRNYADYFIVNLETGTKTKILSQYPSNVMLSPTGKYVVVWAPEEKNYRILLPTGDLLKSIEIPGNFPLFDELNDTPSDPMPYGIAGWTRNDENIFLYDKYDIWSIRISGKEEPINITNGFGRSNNLRFRYKELDPDEEFIDVQGPIYLSAFNFSTKEAGFYSVGPFKKENPAKLIFEKAAFSNNFTRAKKSNTIIWQKESFDVSPDIYVSDMNFGRIIKLSDTNPQQSKYNWITAELFEWTSFDHQELQGILYKPEDFDPSRKYPMIVYFYERSSDGLYRYNPPAPSASTVNRSFAVSNGYLLFVPDIPYKTGYPGESCYNAVISGTYALLNKYSFIDKDRLGLDGQSWGGYQIAWLVTRTDLFKCAFAGAPVSNMISAYGGIRWETGMSRMFQYEHSQSRIGGTLWDKPVHFIENSPIFFVPKINTPLLLMHNDADGAVPWYQGIEFITALRRLEKPAWLLSYNDEAHNLVKRPNRKDLSIRKMQFFDHYLKGSEMPYWMKYGITQTEKGKKDGYNLVISN